MFQSLLIRGKLYHNQSYCFISFLNLPILYKISMAAFLFVTFSVCAFSNSIMIVHASFDTPRILLARKILPNERWVNNPKGPKHTF